MSQYVNASRARSAGPVTSAIVVMIAWLLASGANARAQSTADAARTYFESGTLAFGEARWIDCATDFEQSFALVFAPELLYNIGLCYERAARALPDAQARPLLERALAAYQRYVRDLPDASDLAAVRTSISDLRARLERSEPIAPAPVMDEPAVVEVTVLPPAEPEEAESEGSPLAAPTAPEGGFPITIATGVPAAVSLGIAIGLGVHAQSFYTSLSSSCGRTSEGCTETQIDEVGSLATATTAMYVVAGLAAAGTAIAFGVEFSAAPSSPPTRAVISLSGSF